ncbi:ribosome maturation factor RimM [Pelotalea chapellei]|uniref:Ribosome maturation factor RimM n=1 Tax=Pelotalea chapellei TaxID=44671 RepID=A0ABS5UBK5_9BACT|nr:ribosome maturation factor RimM [Pelotalea chapellei]MBT1073064.1 16S rRNA processing protein RimM [Pelotalea chapellei]
MPIQNALIPVGKLIGTHGIKGLLKLNSYSGNFDSLKAARTITLKFAQGTLQEFDLKSIAPHGGKPVIGLKGVDDINQALPLVGSELCLFRSQLPQTDEDEYYWCDLIGLSVFTVDDVELGTIFDIFETGSSDIYVVRRGEREYLIPAIADVITSVDLENGRVVVTPLEGLLDL